MVRLSVIFGLLIAGLPTLAAAKDVCRMKRFGEVACATAHALKTSISATNAEQLRSVGCLRLPDKSTVTVIEKFDDAVQVTITTKTEIIPFWVNPYALDCSPVPPSVSAGTPQFRSAYERTGDGFVWKEGKRIGWVDDGSGTFYRLDQIEIGKSEKPIIRANSAGVKIQSNLDAAVLASEQAVAAPPGASLERTGDGFVWQAGKRIGWIDASASVYYRSDQIELGSDQIVRQKQGETGSPIEGGRLFEAVARAEKKG